MRLLPRFWIYPSNGAEMKFDELYDAVMAIFNGPNDYCVYMMINSEKMQIYFGVSNDCKNRYQKHAGGKVKATKDWDFKQDSIQYKIISCGHSQEVASKKAHGLEALEKLGEYEIIQTAGE